MNLRFTRLIFPLMALAAMVIGWAGTPVCLASQPVDGEEDRSDRYPTRRVTEEKEDEPGEHHLGEATLREVPPPGEGGGLIFSSTVEASRGTPPKRPTGERDNAPTAFTTVLHQDQAPAGARTVGDLLKTAPGAKIRSTGSGGLFQQLSIRGSETGQVQYFIDGVPLERGAASFIDMGRLPLASVDRVEVFRGTTPAHLGGGGIGGAVNVITYQGLPEDPHRGDLALEAGAGSWATRSLAARGSVPLAKGRGGRLSAAATYEGSEGNFTFFDNNGTPLNPGDDRDTERINNHHRTGRAHLAYQLPIPHRNTPRGMSWFHTKFSSSFTRAGVPGPGTVQAGRASLSLLDTLGEAGITTHNLFIPGSRLQTRVWTSLDNTRFTDPAGEVSLGRPDTNDWNRSLGTWTGARIPMGSHHTMAAGLGLNHETHSPGGPRPQGSKGDKGRLRASVNLGNQWHLFNARITLPLALRVEAIRSTGLPANDLPGKDAGSGKDHPVTNTQVLFSPRTGLKVLPLPWLTLTANGGIYHRVPTFGELYGESGVIVANSALKPERGLNIDGGAAVELARARLHLEVALFHNDLKDALVMIHNTRHTRKAENLGRATITGAELSLRGGPWWGLEVQGSHTLLRAVNNSPVSSQTGKILPGRPQHQFLGSLIHRSFGDRVQVRYDLEATGLTYMDPVNFKPIPPRAIHNLGLEWGIRFLPGTTIQVSVKNITDQRVEQVPLIPRAPGDPETVTQAVSDFIGYPLPGRSFFIMAGWQSGPAKPPVSEELTNRSDHGDY